MAKWKHRLKKLNTENRTAVCEHCGPVSIRLKGQNRWRCGLAHSHGENRINTKPKPKVCDICLLEKPLCWDHDHRTGKHRGWLCNNCNIALGNFYDDINSLERAIKYLKDNRLA